MAQRLRQLFVLVALLAIGTMIGSGQIYAGFGANRTISFYNIHNKERLTVQFKKNGKYVPSALKKANWILRDWRRNLPTRMDPRLLDLVWEIHTELGSKKPVYIISGYRSLKTNNMLRRTRGGQAKRSQHILGKAMDVYFPDIPLKKLRYSALVRQVGGVGYYPTSAIPFVHIDTGRVRHWPRLPRYELALLFPSGHSKHRPVRGGPITPRDVRIAQSRHKRLAVQIASFHTRRQNGPRGSDGRKGWQPSIVVAARQPAKKTPAPKRKVAALMATPRLSAAPRLIRRSQPGGTRPTSSERRQLTALAHTANPRGTLPSTNERKSLARLALAASRYKPRLVQPPRPAKRTLFARLANLGGIVPRSIVDKFTGAASSRPVTTPQQSDGWSNGWVKAPAYDDEHPDEMSYRPFPIAPLLTATAATDDPALSHLTHPDAVQTLDLIDGIDTVPPLQFRPGAQTAQLMLAQQFSGKAVDLDSLYGRRSRLVHPAAGNRLKRRRVMTQGG